MMTKKMKDNLKNLLQVKNSTNTSADLYFYGDIVSDWYGAWTDEDQYPEQVKNFLNDAKGKELNIYINSGGGSVFAGLAIYNMLKRHDGHKTVYVDGLAGSIASVIALAGDRIIIPPSASLMIHKPWSWSAGNATDFRKLADDLDAIEECIMAVYEENMKDGVDLATIKEMVDAETWLDGNKASQYFNIEVGQDRQILNCTSDYFNSYLNVPEKFKNQIEGSQKEQTELEKTKLALELDFI